MRIYQMDKDALQKHFGIDFEYGRSHSEVRRAKNKKRITDDLLGILKMAQSKIYFVNIISLITYFIAAVFSFLNHTMDLFYITLVAFLLSFLAPLAECVMLFYYKRAYYNRIDGKRQKVAVCREGKRMEISADELRVGDVLYLESGIVLQSDARIFSSENLYVDETVVFGATIPAQKMEDALLSETLPAEAQKNMLWKGSFIVSGSGMAVISALGEECYIEKTGGRKAKKQHSVYFNKQSNISRIFSYIYLILISIVLLSGIIFGASAVESVLTMAVLSSLITINPVSFLTEWTYYRTAQKLYQSGNLIRNIEAFDGMNREKTVYLNADDLLNHRLHYRETLEVRADEKTTLSYFSLCMGVGCWSDVLSERMAKYNLNFEELNQKYPVFRSEQDQCGNRYSLFTKGGDSIVIAAGYWQFMLPLLSTVDEDLIAHINTIERRGKFVYLVASSSVDYIPNHLDVSAFSGEMSLVSLLVFDVDVDEELKTCVSRFRKVGVSVALVSNYSEALNNKLLENYDMEYVLSETPEEGSFSNPQFDRYAPAVYESAPQNLKEQASLVLSKDSKPQFVIYQVKCMFCGLKRGLNFLSIIGFAVVVISTAMLLSEMAMSKLLFSLLLIAPISLVPCYYLLETTRNCVQYKRSYLLGAFCAFSGIAMLFFGCETALLALGLSLLFLSIYLMVAAVRYRKIRMLDIIILGAMLILVFLPWIFIGSGDWLASIIMALFPVIASFLLELLY